jgi:CRP/FNR family transcriptional regulator
LAQNYHHLVSKNPVFASLSYSELNAILAEGVLRRYEKGSMIVLAGDTWPYLFLVVQGQISALKESSEGRSLLISTFEISSIFWGIAFFHEGASMPVSLEARQHSEILLWSRERFLPFLLTNGRIGWELSCQMVNQMLHASNIVEKLAFQPVAGRVAQFLLEQTPAGQDVSPRHLTLDEIAARLGTTREMVCRYLHSFSDEGLINITRTEYYITDRQGLKLLTRQAKG